MHFLAVQCASQAGTRANTHTPKTSVMAALTVLHSGGNTERVRDIKVKIGRKKIDSDSDREQVPNAQMRLIFKYHYYPKLTLGQPARLWTVHMIILK